MSYHHINFIGKKLRHRKDWNPESWALTFMFLITTFCLHKRDETMVGAPRKSLPSGRQMYNFFNSSWDPHIHGFCCLKTYQAKMYLVGKIIFHLPPGQLVLSSMLSGLRFEDLQTDKLHNPVKVSLNISHVNSTLTVSTRLIYSSQFILSFS